MKFYKTTMDYRPDNPNKPKYYKFFYNNVNLTTAKWWFRHTYSWLKLYDCVEISEEEYQEYWERVKKHNEERDKEYVNQIQEA